MLVVHSGRLINKFGKLKPKAQAGTEARNLTSLPKNFGFGFDSTKFLKQNNNQ